MGLLYTYSVRVCGGGVGGSGGGHSDVIIQYIVPLFIYIRMSTLHLNKPWLYSAVFFQTPKTGILSLTPVLQHKPQVEINTQ